MDKPISMHLKDYLIRVMSVKTNTPANIINAVITHQFEELIEMLPYTKSVEISGFGKFLFNKKKAEKRLEKELSKVNFWKTKLEGEISEAKIKTLNVKLENANNLISYITNKLNVK